MKETQLIDTTMLTPQMNIISEYWWEGIQQNELRIQYCLDCKTYWFPVIHCCPYCASERWEWRTSGGQGKLYSWAVIHRAFNPAYIHDVPYTIVAVNLEEGPRVFGRYLGKPMDELQPDMKLQAKAFQKEHQWLLGFEPVDL